MGKITVVGSSNTDLVATAPHIPEPGETVIGSDFLITPGGKGANQAVAAARLGGDVSFIACVGNDMFGKQAMEHFREEKLDVRYVRTDAEKPSGVALICVDKSAENSIVVAPGANNSLCRADIDNAAEVIKESEYVLVQLEVPLEVVEYVGEMTAGFGKRLILNPAPAKALPLKLISNTWLATPNRTEARQLTGIPVENVSDAEKAASELLGMGVKNVMITLGASGCFFMNVDRSMLIPAKRVKALDTTGAGDTFNGALTVALSEGAGFEQAIKFATAASAISVTRMGAQASMPFRSEMNL